MNFILKYIMVQLYNIHHNKQKTSTHTQQHKNTINSNSQTRTRLASELLSVFAVHVQIPQRRELTDCEVHPLVEIAAAANEGRRVAGVQRRRVQMSDGHMVLVTHKLAMMSSVGDVVTYDLFR